MQRAANTRKFSAAVTLVWVAAVAFITSRHELWLDEAHHFLLARDSESTGALLDHLHYEGHPPLWSLLLKTISGITDAAWGMQALHILFGAGTVYLVLRHAPFPQFVSLLLPFTYFLGYEYAVVTRNYAPAVFFLVLACVLFGRDKRNVIGISLALGLAALSHAYAAAIATLLGVYFFSGTTRTGHERLIVIATVIFAACLATVALFAFPPEDHFLFALHGDTVNLKRMGHVAAMPFLALLHFPDLATENWWNTNLFLPVNDVLAAIAAIVTWIVFAALFFRDGKVFILYLAGAVILSVVMLLTPMPLSVRHAGFFALLFFLCAWLMAAHPKHKPVRMWKRVVLTIILLTQVAAFGTTAVKEITAPFSEAKQTAEWIKGNYPSTAVMVYPHYTAPSISFYLRAPVYCAERDTMQTYASWKAENFIITQEQAMNAAKAYMHRTPADSLLLVVGGGQTLATADGSFQLMKTFANSCVQAENYSVYLITK